ncbi:MAG: HEPN domain-containing protein [Myxococcales bacterium]|nr:HEPN domain-containing protein [Myxococcales bacterium]
MSPGNLRANIESEADRGGQALREAEELLRAELFYGAASRAYYAVFHLARALCLAAGEEPRSHEGVAHLLSLLYVKSGKLPVDTSRLFAELQKYREQADYNSAFVLDLAGARQAVDAARALAARFRDSLKEQGLLAE